MDDALIKAMLELGAIGIAAIAIWQMSRSSGKTQGAILDVQKQQMSNEGKRDEVEKQRLQETVKRNAEDARHNKNLEDLLASLLKSTADEHREISMSLGSIEKKQDAIVQGVRAMNNHEMTAVLKKLEILLNTINEKLDKALTPSPVVPPSEDDTKQLAPPTSTVADEMLSVDNDTNKE